MNSNAGLTITINAQTAQAAQQLQQFFGNAVGGINRMQGAATALQSVASRLAAAVSVGVLTNFARQTLNLADELGKLSQRTGLSVEMLDALRKQGELADVSFQEMAGGLRLFNDRIYSAVTQGGTAAQVFRDLNLAVAGLDGSLRPTQQILEEIADQFQTMPDGPRKTALALDLFGRAGAQWIPLLNQGAEGMRAMRNQEGGITTETAARAEEFNDTVTEIKQNFQELAVVLLKEALPALQKTVDRLKELTSGTSLKGMALTLVMELSKAITSTFVTLFAEIVKLAAEAVAGFVELIGRAIDAVMEKFRGMYILLKPIFGVGSWPMRRTVSFDIREGVAEYIKLVEFGTKAATVSLDAFFNRGITAAQSLYGSKPGKPGPASDPAPPPDGNKGALGLSVEAQKLWDNILKAHTDATKGSLELLAIEERALLATIDREFNDVTKAEEAKLKVRETYAKKRAEIELQAETEIRQQREQAIMSDWQATDAQKFATLQQEGFDPKGPDPTSFGQQWQAALVGMQNQLGTFAQYTASSFANIAMSGVSMVSNGITEMIMAGKSFGEVMQQVGQQIVSQLIQVAVQALIVSAILTPLGLGGFAGGAAGGALPGFASGGYTGAGGKNELAGLVHRGEFVFSAQDVERLGLNNLQSMREGSALAPVSSPSSSAPNIKFVLVADMKQAALEAMNSEAGERVIVQKIGNRRTELGFQT